METKLGKPFSRLEVCLVEAVWAVLLLKVALVSQVNLIPALPHKVIPNREVSSVEYSVVNLIGTLKVVLDNLE